MSIVEHHTGFSVPRKVNVNPFYRKGFPACSSDAPRIQCTSSSGSLTHVDHPQQPDTVRLGHVQYAAAITMVLHLHMPDCVRSRAVPRARAPLTLLNATYSTVLLHEIYAYAASIQPNSTPSPAIETTLHTIILVTLSLYRRYMELFTDIWNSSLIYGTLH